MIKERIIWTRRKKKELGNENECKDERSGSRRNETGAESQKREQSQFIRGRKQQVERASGLPERDAPAALREEGDFTVVERARERLETERAVQRASRVLRDRQGLPAEWSAQAVPLFL